MAQAPDSEGHSTSLLQAFCFMPYLLLASQGPEQVMELRLKSKEWNNQLAQSGKAFPSYKTKGMDSGEG